MIRTRFKRKEYPALKVVSVKCKACNGVGFIENGTSALTCDKCDGKGFVDVQSNG